MQKYLSIYLSTPAARTQISASNVSGVNMASVSTVKIWYHDGGSATITLSDNMTASDDTVSNYFIDKIAAAQATSWTNVTTEIPATIPGALDAGAAAVTLVSVALA